MRKRHHATTEPTPNVGTSIDTSIDTIMAASNVATIADGRDDTSAMIADGSAIDEPIAPIAIDTPETRFHASFPTIENVPTWFGPFSSAIDAGFMACDARPTITAIELVPIVTAAIVNADGSPIAVGSNGRVSSMGIRYGQNAIYVTLACSGRTAAKTPNALIMALWAMEYPNAKCDFVNRVYGHSTLTDFVNDRHGDCPGIPTAIDVVRVWRNTR